METEIKKRQKSYIKNVLNNVRTHKSISNEDLFVALRLCESKVCLNSIWKYRINLIKEAIVNQNIGLIKSCVFRFRGNPDHLYSEALFIFTRCLKSFDVSKGYKWTSYVFKSMARALYKLQQKKTLIISFDPNIDLPQEKPDDYSDDIFSIRKLLDTNEANLTKRELGIIKQRFYGKKTLLCVGQKYGVSKERTRQLEKKAIQKFKTFLKVS